ncbi:hypothetical protein HMF8227_02309 [Saliniradius amylolyticus]|uniref:Zinc finger DksA/TraR C4-type domain-containing protein n=1 Tax=Saliniradius amylolyticus TaxID=2183582 RepID=A0A2S2E5F5_9ALTE|nr:TraR/DksA family transcriptional regulator [Saliniradius amylolyticus]AWL12762.1 hypothetical protein HMF8227_02309 [Saliniradius amylolyticus]
MANKNAQYHKKLMQMQQELQATSEASDESGDQDTVTLDQTSVGRLSRVDALQAQQMALEQERRRQHRLNLVKMALRRLEQDDFGFCLECGEPIAPARLEYDPSVLYCIDCAEKHSNQ